MGGEAGAMWRPAASGILRRFSGLGPSAAWAPSGKRASALVGWSASPVGMAVTRSSGPAFRPVCHQAHDLRLVDRCPAVVPMSAASYVGGMATNHPKAAGEKRNRTKRGHYRSAATGRYISAALAEEMSRSGKVGAVALATAKRRALGHAAADEQALVRLARSAEAARSNPGENLSGLSDEEFLKRLLG